MSDDAEVQMLLYADLRPKEEAKLKSIDADIYNLLLQKGIEKRAIWSSKIKAGYRAIQLLISTDNKQKMLYELSEEQLDTLCASDIIQQLQKNL